MVACDQQPPAGTVPDGKGEHPAEPGHHAFPVLLVQVHQRLGVTAGLEAVALGDNLIVQAGKVVQLAVEDHHDAAVLVGHRLVAAGEVDNTEPPHAEAETAFDEGAPIIGTPVRDRVAHPEDLAFTDRSRAGLSCYATHLRPPSSS